MSEKKVKGSFPAQSGYGHARTRPYRQYAEIAVLGVAIALIWTVLTLPTVFYHLPVEEDSTNSSSIGPRPRLQSDECSSEVYTGSICRSALQSLQNCIPDRCGSTEVYILSDTSQSEIEKHVMRLLGGLGLLNPSSECLEAVAPFLCSYYFGLCSSDNQPYLPSSGQCETIATETCAAEFEQAIALLGRDALPQCETLPAVPTFEFDCPGLGGCPGVPESETVAPETTDPNSSSPTDSDVFESPNGTCSSEVYTGQICRSALQSLQNCIPDRCGSSEVYIPSDTSQSEIESHVMRLLGGLELLNARPECLAAVAPFLCSYYFGLCSSDNQPYLPSSAQCETIATETCAAEFEQAISLLGRDALPQCETLSAVPTFGFDCPGLGGCPGVPENETVTPETTDPNISSPTDTDVSESPNGTCSSEVYTGQICQSTLQSLQNCIPDRCGSSEVYVPSSGRQIEIEQQLTTLLTGLQLLNPSEVCQAAIVPFLCFYSFGLCDSSNELHLPSFEDCVQIGNQTCAAEFQRAISFVGRVNLPQCETLPTTSVISLQLECSEECETDMTTATPTRLNNVIAGSNFSGSKNIPALTCRKGFYLEQRNGSGGACIPECGKWEEFSHHLIVTGDVIVIVQAVVYIIAAAVLLVMSCIHHKRMFKFPAIFVIYEMFPLGLFEVSILIAFMDRTALYCSSKNLIESLKSPTVFCNIQGGVSHFIFMQQHLLWLFHIIAVFWTIRFPFHAKSFETKGYTKFVHFGMIALTFIVASISVAVLFGTGGCRGARIPAIICLARETDATFYAFELPLSIGTAAGISLIVYMFWILYHITRDLSHIQKQKKEEEKGEKEKIKRRFTSLKHHVTFNAAEMKILIIFIYFSVFFGSILITFTITLHGFENRISGIGKYFTCESIGIQEEACIRSFEKIKSEVSAIITYALIGLYPLVSLIYVVNIQELRQKYSWLLKRTGHKEITSTSGTFRRRGTSTSTGV